MEHGTFNDPVVRCVDCQRVVSRSEIHVFGMCPGCGTKRVKNVLLLTQDEMEVVEEKFPDFALCFDPKILGSGKASSTIWTKAWEAIDE